MHELLDDDLVTYVFSFLDQKSLLNIQTVCRDWQRCSLDPTLWPRVEISERVADFSSALSVVTRRYASFLLDLSLRNCPVSDRDVSGLKVFSHLRKLDLYGCNNVTDEGISLLTELPVLESINLVWCKQMTDVGLSRLVSGCSHALCEINLSDCSGLGAEGLSQLALCPRLRLLDLAFLDNLTDSWLAPLTSLSNLESLSLRGCHRVHDCVLDFFRGCSGLRSLNLSGCGNISDQGLETLERFTHLEHLSLQSCHRITDAGLVHLRHCSHLRSIELCNIGGLTDEGIQCLSSCRELRTVNLRLCEKILDLSCEHIANACPLLREVSLALCTNVTDAGLVALSRCKQLTVVDLTECPVSNESLSNLSHCPVLASLTLDCCSRLTDYGLKKLCRNRPGLQTLSLKYCTEVTDAGLRYLSACSRLVRLDLGYCPLLTDMGLMHLVCKLDAVQALQLDGCGGVTDNVLEHIGLCCPNLKHISLRHCPNMSYGGLSYLMRSTRVTHNL